MCGKSTGTLYRRCPSHLRAVRFSAQLGFSIEEKTKEAAKVLAPTLKNISAERIQTELLKLLVSKNPHYLKTAWELGITKIVLPEFDVLMETSMGEKTLKAFAYTSADKAERLAVLFANMEKTPEKSRDLAKKILRRLRFDNDTINKVSELVFGIPVLGNVRKSSANCFKPMHPGALSCAFKRSQSRAFSRGKTR